MEYIYFSHGYYKIILKINISITEQSEIRNIYG